MEQNVRFYYTQEQVNHLCPNHITYTVKKFSSKTQRFQVGNGQHVSVLFIIPLIVEIAGHRFEVYTLVFEIHENIDLVLGIKMCLN